MFHKFRELSQKYQHNEDYSGSYKRKAVWAFLYGLAKMMMYLSI